MSDVQNSKPHVFGPDDPLEASIRAGDCDATIECLRRLTPAGRKSRREGLKELGKLIQYSHWGAVYSFEAWGAEATKVHYRAYETALLVCGQPEDFLQAPDSHPCIDAATCSALCELFDLDAVAWRTDLQAQTEKLLQAGTKWFRGIVGIQRLISAGLIDRPASDEYVVALISLPRVLHWTNVGGVRQLFAQDPGLYQVALRLFEIEGNSEDNLAAIDKYSKQPEREWTNIFLQALADGAYTRGQLLDKTLGTLESDWPQFRAGWFSNFHRRLAPGLSELTPRVERYLGLCQSRIAPTVTLALEALKTLLDAEALPAPALLAALPPVLNSGIKGQVEAALKLLDTAVKREPAAATQASAVAMAGLVHESAEVQKKVLQRLAAWSVDDTTRLALADYLPGIAAVHRPALAALLGQPLGTVPAAAADTPPPEPIDLQPVTPLDPGRALLPLDDPDELLDRSAFVLENDLALDDFERVAEALVRLAPFSAELRQRFSPLVKRARKIKPDRPVACELARLVRWVMHDEQVESWDLAQRKQWTAEQGVTFNAAAYLGMRIDDWIELASRGAGLAPLSAATHRRGFIAPAVLVERAAAHQARGLISSSLEQVQALLRLPPGAGVSLPEAVLDTARALPDTPFHSALRHALGDAVSVAAKRPQDRDVELERELFFAAARIRCPGADDPVTLAAYGDLGPDTGAAARFQWTVQAWTWQPTRPTEEAVTHHDLELVTQTNPVLPPPCAVARQRFPLAAAEAAPLHNTWQLCHFSGHHEAMVMYAASLAPGSLDAFFAGGAWSIGKNIRWPEAQWQDNAYLKLLQDPTVPLSAMARLTLAVALSAKEPGLVALAVDALVQSHADGRLDAAALGATVGELLAAPLVVMAARYRKSLQAAVRGGAAAPSLVFELLCAMLAALGDPAPKDLAALLELLLELALTLRRPLPGPSRAALGRLTLGGKGRALQKELMRDTLA